MLVLAAETSPTTTTTTEVPQIVGKYPGELPVLGSAGVLFVVIVAAGSYMTLRSRRANAAKSNPGDPPTGDSAAGDVAAGDTAAGDTAAGEPTPKRGGG